MINFPPPPAVRLGGLMAGSCLLLGTFAACNRNEAPPSTVLVQAAPAQAMPPPAAAEPSEDDYQYYPQYEVYYSNTRHQYAYRDGSAWVWRPAPPHVAVNILLASPSVHMDFHDAPSRHHEAIVRAYPRNWAPPGKGRDDHKDDKPDDRKDRH